jgi:hypothetical protein
MSNSNKDYYCSSGDIFKGPHGYYILCRPIENEYRFINLETGNRWNSENVARIIKWVNGTEICEINQPGFTKIDKKEALEILINIINISR